jgi:hypothetical protein
MPTMEGSNETNSLYSLKRIINSTKESMRGQEKEFKTKLRFNPNRFSTAILKRYLVELLDSMDLEELLQGDAPAEYMKDADNRTNYKVLKELGIMSVKEWKERLGKNNGNVECLYLHDDMMLHDSKEFYECWKIIQDEVGNHEKQMSFFRLVSEIVSDLSERNVVELTLLEGEQVSLKNHELDDKMKVIEKVVAGKLEGLEKEKKEKNENPVKKKLEDVIQMEKMEWDWAGQTAEQAWTGLSGEVEVEQEHEKTF